MSNIFDLFDPKTFMNGNAAKQSLAAGQSAHFDAMLGFMRESMNLNTTQFEALQLQASRIFSDHIQGFGAIAERSGQIVQQVLDRAKDGELLNDAAEYQVDAAERSVLTLDTLRKRGDIFLEHEGADCPPVLIYDYRIVIDGADLPDPTNYVLLEILPIEGQQLDPDKRPYMIIDPRAGHGPGIGGFKDDSQVGVALAAGHPVYFVAFKRMPHGPDQVIADVTRAEAAFVREIKRRHPNSSNPIVVGNCQGGWAALLLAATNPDIIGPIVVNGAPVATWAGTTGTNPLRYNGGVLGGTWIPMFVSDLGAGIFDGAHLVSNFELLNPSRNYLTKYTDLFRDIDKGDKSFLDNERWWGGFFLLSGEEIQWIVEQLFVGNRLVRNQAMIEPGQHVDLKAIRAPIIVFASHGDNITPPQQALNWITETYSDVDEIRIHGQRIVYMVHEKVGHLGIFVSSSIARREHSQVASTLETIETLPPGLYEMIIEDVQESDGDLHFDVEFAMRTFDDIRALDDGMIDEKPFAAVARASEAQAAMYEMFMRPLVKASANEAAAEANRALHPMRTSRAILASRNPAMRIVQAAAERVAADRHKAAPKNPLLALESLGIDAIEQSIDLWRDLRDMQYEQIFFTLWGTPWARSFGETHEERRKLKTHEEIRGLPAVAAALYEIDHGGFPEAVIRMLILLSGDQGYVRRDRLERASELLHGAEPFKSLGAEKLAMIIQQQTLIASLEPEKALEALPNLLKTMGDRMLAARVLQYVPGDMAEMSPAVLEMLQRFREVLGVPQATEDERENPLLAKPGDFMLPESEPQLDDDVATDVTALESPQKVRAPSRKGTVA